MLSPSLQDNGHTSRITQLDGWGRGGEGDPPVFFAYSSWLISNFSTWDTSSKAPAFLVGSLSTTYNEYRLKINMWGVNMYYITILYKIKMLHAQVPFLSKTMTSLLIQILTSIISTISSRRCDLWSQMLRSILVTKCTRQFGLIAKSRVKWIENFLHNTMLYVKNINCCFAHYAASEPLLSNVHVDMLSSHVFWSYRPQDRLPVVHHHCP